MSKHVNGIDVDSLSATMGELKKDPVLGQCRFRASNRWIEQTGTTSRIRGYYAVRQEMQHPETFEIPSDEPALIGGADTAAAPGEILLAALASCVTSSMVIHAALEGIEIEEVESEIEGDIDLNGFAGLTDAPKGYQQIRLRLTVKSDADTEHLRELALFSPTLHTVMEGPGVDLEVTKPPSREATAPEQPAQPAP